MSGFLRVALTEPEVLERAKRLAECQRQLGQSRRRAKRLAECQRQLGQLDEYDPAEREYIAAEREYIAAERKSLVREINCLAEAIRTGSEDRTEQLGLWPDQRP